jgi:hypothetical protein
MGRTALKKGPETALIYSTTLGRMHFADFVQLAYGEKILVGFDRYGRTLAAIAPIEAVKMLAGQDDDVPPRVREQIQRAAEELLDSMPAHTGLDALSSGMIDKAPRAIVELEEIEARRKRRKKRAAARKRQG